MDEKNNALIFTGERFIPGTTDTHLALEHIQRYDSILPLVKGKTVLDAACGEGYGCSILSAAAAKVIGVDIDARAIRHAADTYAIPDKIEFFAQDVADLPLPDSSVDVVVSFETVEHLLQDVQMKFLGEIVRVLKKDGILVMSTPNKEVYSDHPGYQNDFHVKEFYRDEFFAFLHRKFQNIHFYQQYFEIVSIIDSSADGMENAVYKKDGKYKGNGKYMIAVAGNGSIPSVDISHIYMSQYPEYNAQIQRILQLQQEVDERNQHIRKLDMEIHTDRETIQKQKQEVDERNQHIKKLGLEIHTNRETIQKQKEAAEAYKKAIAKANQEATDWEQLSMRQKQDVLKKQAHIAQLLKVEREYERVKQSWTFLLAGRILKTSRAVFPSGSRRRLIAERLFHRIRKSLY